jgi:hypothetical protein
MPQDALLDGLGRLRDAFGLLAAFARRARGLPAWPLRAGTIFPSAGQSSTWKSESEVDYLRLRLRDGGLRSGGSDFFLCPLH